VYINEYVRQHGGDQILLHAGDVRSIELSDDISDGIIF
jgi:hypothetical protein